LDIQKQYTVKVARTVNEIKTLKSDWEKLQWHPNASYSYYLGLLEARSAIKRPHVTTLFEDGLPRAMIVGRIETGHLQIKIGYRGLWAHKLRFLSISYGGVLGDTSPFCCDMLIDELSNAIRRKEADVIYLNHLNANSPLYASAVNKCGFLCRDHFPGRSIHWQTVLPESINDVYHSLSAKRRQNLRWKARQLEKNFSGSLNISLRNVTNDVPKIVQDVETVARKSYQRSLGAGFTDDEETRQRILLLARLGWLRTYILYVGSEPCAFWMGTLFDDTFHLDYTGFDPKYRNYEPGVYLFMKMLEDLCRIGVKVVDFGFGDALYKRRFGNRSWEETSVFLFPPTCKGIALNTAKSLTAGLSEIGNRLLSRSGALQHIKTRWRNRLRTLDIDEK
jgi:hypothetical protein